MQKRWRSSDELLVPNGRTFNCAQPVGVRYGAEMGENSLERRLWPDERERLPFRTSGYNFHHTIVARRNLPHLVDHFAGEAENYVARRVFEPKESFALGRRRPQGTVIGRAFA